MPKYVINRRFEVGEDEMPEVGRRSRRIIEEEFPNVVWIHSHVAVEDDGRVRTFSLYEAPDLDAIQTPAELLGQQTTECVCGAAGDVTPGDFPPISEQA